MSISRTWSAEDELLLIESHILLGSKWVSIAKQLSSHSEMEAKNHWYSTLRSKKAIKSGRKPSLLHCYAVIFSSSPAADVQTPAQRQALLEQAKSMVGMATQQAAASNGMATTVTTFSGRSEPERASSSFPGFFRTSESGGFHYHMGGTIRSEFIAPEASARTTTMASAYLASSQHQHQEQSNLWTSSHRHSSPGFFSPDMAVGTTFVGGAGPSSVAAAGQTSATVASDSLEDIRAFIRESAASFNPFKRTSECGSGAQLAASTVSPFSRASGTSSYNVENDSFNRASVSSAHTPVDDVSFNRASGCGTSEGGNIGSSSKISPHGFLHSVLEASHFVQGGQQQACIVEEPNRVNVDMTSLDLDELLISMLDNFAAS